MININNLPPGDYIQKFGRLPDIDASEGGEDVWDGEGAYSFLTTATAMKISSSTTVDTAAGTGVRTAVVWGVDANYQEFTETVTMSGQDGVSLTNTPLRVYRIYGDTVGSSGVNGGDVWVGYGTITSGVPANKVAGALAGNGQTLMAIYTIPKISLTGESYKTAHILSWYATCGAGQAAYATVALQTREEGKSWRSRRVMGIGEGGFMKDDISFGIKVPTGSDIRVRVLSNGVANSSIEAGFDLLIEKAY